MEKLRTKISQIQTDGSKQPRTGKDLEVVSPLKTIRRYCLGCGNGSPLEVRLCPHTKCELYLWRLGHDPRREKKVITEGQRKKLQARLKNKNCPVNTGGELGF
jgi:hypothetical protein